MESLELERPFACSVCQESFVQSKALAEHVKVVHLLRAPENIKKIRDVSPKEKKSEDLVLKQLRVVLERIDKPNGRSTSNINEVAKTTKGFRYLENKSKDKDTEKADQIQISPIGTRIKSVRYSRPKSTTPKRTGAMKTTNFCSFIDNKVKDENTVDLPRGQLTSPAPDSPKLSRVLQTKSKTLKDIQKVT